MDKTFIPQLNSLRFFAAIAIVIFHFGKWSWPFDSTLNNYALIMNIGVSFFFVLSGLIMTIVYKHLKTFSKDRVKDFYKKRALRIVPLYILALVVVFILYIFMGGISHKILITQFFENLFFLQAWHPINALSLNFTGWSLSVEMFFYAIFPLIFPFVVSRKNKLKEIFAFWMISNLIVVFLCFNLDQNNLIINYFTKYFPLLHLNQFLIGIIAGLYYLKGIKKGNNLFILSFLFLLIYLPFVSKGLINIAHHDGLLAPVFALMIIGAASSKGLIKKILSHPLLVKAGDASYGIYILQFPVYYFVYEAYKFFNVFSVLHEEGRFYLFVVVLVLISYLSSKTFELWVKKKLN